MTGTWKFKPGEAAQGKCPLCRRSLGAHPVVLDPVDMENEICRCGRVFNATARRRIRIWMCTRKVAYTLEEAEAVTIDMRANVKGLMHPYLCPFHKEHSAKPYHVGAETKPD